MPIDSTDTLDIVSPRNCDGAWRVVVSGEVDLQSGPKLEAALASIEQPGAHAALDLAAVPFIDSAGLRVVVVSALRLSGANGLLRVEAASRAVRSLLRVSGPDQVLSIAGDQID